MRTASLEQQHESFKSEYWGLVQCSARFYLYHSVSDSEWDEHSSDGLVQQRTALIPALMPHSVWLQHPGVHSPLGAASPWWLLTFVCFSFMWTFFFFFQKLTIPVLYFNQNCSKWFLPHNVYVYFLCGLMCTWIHESVAELICMRFFFFFFFLRCFNILRYASGFYMLLFVVRCLWCARACVFFIGIVQRNWACLTWKSAIEIKSLLLLLLLYLFVCITGQIGSFCTVGWLFVVCAWKWPVNSKFWWHCCCWTSRTNNLGHYTCIIPKEQPPIKHFCFMSSVLTFELMLHPAIHLAGYLMATHPSHSFFCSKTDIALGITCKHFSYALIFIYNWFLPFYSTLCGLLP